MTTVRTSQFLSSLLCVLGSAFDKQPIHIDIHSLTYRWLGEGGTFALYSLLAKYSHIVRRDPNVAGTVKMERYLTNDLKPMNKGVRTFIERSLIARISLKIFGVLGVSMVMVCLLQISTKTLLTPSL
jgi:hypothetical protein